MNIYSTMRAQIEQILHHIALEQKCTFNTEKITVEQPRDLNNGDMATNAALLLCKAAKTTPKQLADMICERLITLDMVKEVHFCPPGFINISLQKSLWSQVLQSIVTLKQEYGSSTVGGGEKVNVEYVSTNPTGPLHVGHARVSVFGDILAKILQKNGFAVTREYYINDAGEQMDILARSAYIRYQQTQGKSREIPEGFYPGVYLKEVGEILRQKFGDSLMDKKESEWLDTVRRIAVDTMMKNIKEDLESLGVMHDVFRSEREIVEGGGIQEAFAILNKKHLLYKGTLPPPKGDHKGWEQREQTLFKSTNFGDSSDRALAKSDGRHTYFASDIAYHLDKYKRGFLRQIAVWGADHSGYVKRMCGAVTAISDNKASLHVKICQMVKLKRGGEARKMSKRAGDFLLLKDFVNDVGRDVVRFFLMTRKADAPLDFDLDLVKEQSRENPVFYIQYAHARCCSVLRQAREQGFCHTKGNSKILTHDAFIRVIKELSLYPRVVESVAENFEPHRIAFYLIAVASKFHELWESGLKNQQLRFVDNSRVEGTNAALMLVFAVKTVLENGLDIFSIRAKDVL